MHAFDDGIVLRWRGELSDEELSELVASHGGTPSPGWWNGSARTASAG